MKLFLKESGIFCLSSWDSLKYADVHFNGICYLEKSIIIGEDSFLDFIKLNKVGLISEGRFTAAYPLDDLSKWVIINDESGQGLLFYYNVGKNWAVSNSFLYLVEFLKKKNVKLSFNDSSTLGMQAFHSTTEQLISHSTLVNEIRLLEYNKFITIDNNIFHIENKQKSLSFSYEDGMIEYVNTWASRLNALSLKSDNISCDLTGGYDSRTVFGLLLASGSDISKISIRSNRLQEDDYKVANVLSEHYKLKLNLGSFKHKISYTTEKAFELWKYGNLGIYFPVYSAINDYTQTTNIQLHGAGGGGLRGTINDASPTQMASRLASRIKDKYSSEKINEFKKEFIQGAKEAGFKSDDSLNHNYYNYYRSRMHFGRNQYRSLYSNLITPLTSSKLHNLKNNVPKGSCNNQVYIDLQLLCDHDLPFFDFDLKERNFSKNEITSSIFYSRKFNPKIESIDVYSINYVETDSKVLNKQTYNEILCSELNDWSYYIVNMGFCTCKDLDGLINDILVGKNLTRSLKLASYLLAVAEIRFLCS